MSLNIPAWNYLTGKKVLVTGGAGFLGQHVVEVLKNGGLSEDQIVVPRSRDYDLRRPEQASEMVNRLNPDIIISLAARLGGIGDNRMYPASYFFDNLMIGVNVIEAARHAKIEKLVMIGTVCSYPKIVPAPFKEADLWNGFPEETNAAYGVSKKAVGMYAEAVKTQYGLNTVNLLVTNLYGPGDDFREQTSHVIPAIIKKIIKAKDEGADHIVAWGDGSPSRDFVYVRDAAEGIVRAAEFHNDSAPVNIGAGREIRVKELIEYLCKFLGFEGEIIWDTSKPNGQPRRLLDISKAETTFGFNPSTSFETGLKNTVDWYLANRSELDLLAPKYANRS